MNSTFLVTKASGEKIPFDKNKLITSLKRVGTDKQTIENIVNEVESLLYDGITTKKIYQKAFSILRRKKNQPIASKYQLKKAIMELGPSGYPFEIYVGEIFKSMGYKTKVGQIFKGHCVKHEVDVIAEKDDIHYLIECKYHSNPGYSCNVKIPLYIHSRFQDIVKQLKKSKTNEYKNYYGWVVNNTRFTTDAIQYGECAGLKLLSWDYPQKQGLKDLIDKSKLYPVSSLTSLNKHEKQLLLSNKIVLCKELIYKQEKLIKLGFTSKKIQNVLNECKKLCDV